MKTPKNDACVDKEGGRRSSKRRIMRLLKLKDMEAPSGTDKEKSHAASNKTGCKGELHRKRGGGSSGAISGCGSGSGSGSKKEDRGKKRRTQYENEMEISLEPNKEKPDKGVTSKFSKEDTPATSAESSEPRRRATSMLMSVLGSSTAAVQCCSAIEEELFSTQGREVGKDYLSCLRNAVFGMEGPEGQRLRRKVLSGMVLPRDFASKSSDELRAFANML